MSTIVWQPAKTVGNYAGFVGRLKSFAIGEVYSIQSDKHVYFVVSERFDIRFTKVDTLDQAKAIAEQRLAEFLSEANLMFVEPKPRKLVEDKVHGTELSLDQLELKDLPNDQDDELCNACYFYDEQSMRSICHHPLSNKRASYEIGCIVDSEKYINNKIFIPIKEVASA